MIENKKFNLIDDPWIPVASKGLVSLKTVFSDYSLTDLSGNPMEKISTLKLLQVIAQSAYTPQDEDDWLKLGSHGLAEKCISYLEKWHDRFFLYGDKPFLQMPDVNRAKKIPISALLPEVSTGNATVFSNLQMISNLNDADKAMLILVQSGFCFGGKKVDNSVVLSKTYKGKQNDKGKPSSGKAGACIGFQGHLHSYLLSNRLVESIWLNIFTSEQIKTLGQYKMGIGVAPWEDMPASEDCDISVIIRNSLLGRLIPLCRFILIDDQEVHYSEGLNHLSYKDGMFDPSMIVSYLGKDPKALWVDPTKKPWRSLASIFSFLSEGTTSFECLQLKLVISRMPFTNDELYIWSGGIRVSSNAGEQFVTGVNDYVDSRIHVPKGIVGTEFYTILNIEMNILEDISKILYASMRNYFNEFQMKNSDLISNFVSLFWQKCENDFQELVFACEDNTQESKSKRLQIRKIFCSYAREVYDVACPKNTARQIQFWSKNLINTRKILNSEI
jgi:CRISPR system Cascade subunit CasA